MTHARLYDDRACQLGEGPLWHPERKQLFWFDILRRHLLSREGDTPIHWEWEEMVSAAGWVDRDTLLVAGETAFWRFDVPTSTREKLIDLEADTPANRSNDGRADPLGGFWVGTMGKQAEPEAGGIYRYFRGEVRKLYEAMTIPNSICFSPAGDTAYFADTAKGAIWKQHIDRAGWPSGKPEIFVNYSNVGLAPDGAVCDADGNVWVAQWGAGRVACHGPDGRFRDAVHCGAAQTTCPAFGGPELRQLHVTSALQGLPDNALPHQPGAGRTWVADMAQRGQAEHKVVL